MERDYEREHREDLERLRALRPIDDDFMRCLFANNLPLAQEETQRDLRRLAGARSVVLDVFGRDARGTWYEP